VLRDEEAVGGEERSDGSRHPDQGFWAFPRPLPGRSLARVTNCVSSLAPSPPEEAVVCTRNGARTRRSARLIDREVGSRNRADGSLSVFGLLLHGVCRRPATTTVGASRLAREMLLAVRSRACLPDESTDDSSRYENLCKDAGKPRRLARCLIRATISTTCPVWIPATDRPSVLGSHASPARTASSNMISAVGHPHCSTSETHCA
jgi:hypothetical protein